MTIYIHFNDGTAPERLHNVDAVADAGKQAVTVRMTFGDRTHTYHHVSHVALNLNRDE